MKSQVYLPSQPLTDPRAKLTFWDLKIGDYFRFESVEDDMGTCDNSAKYLMQKIESLDGGKPCYAQSVYGQPVQIPDNNVVIRYDVEITICNPQKYID